ncbi:hypothetical protein [Luteibacter sp. 329MFSha]|uniref:hypothetical protein n=1 Tax=Luteibacter sp. 329MFSha TaxID=1798239 RepID=UPI0008B9914E|nr:hypothetical protein [Luteibacter sp. 329MFSha]SEW06343.1 hypothetical protein SAMN04515660_2219 [Luteibacter sp. 329MFSha]
MQPRYQASVGRGILWGIIIAAHVGLIAWLYAMRARPDVELPYASQEQPMDALRVRFVSASVQRRQPIDRHAPKVVTLQTSASRTLRAPSSIPSRTPEPASGRPPGQPSEPSADSVGPTGGAQTDADSLPHFSGNPDLRQPTWNAAPRAPGASDGELAKTFHVRRETSIDDSVRGIGRYMACSRVQMKRNQVGGSIDPTVATAYAALGCKK